MMTKHNLLFGALAATLVFPSHAEDQDIRISLGEASNFNVVVFNDFSAPSSKVEGRLAVGGDLSIRGYSIADELDDDESPAYPFSVVVGGDASFPTGRVYEGHVAVGGSADGIGRSVRYGLSREQMLWENIEMPIDFAALKAELEQLSTNLSNVQANGSVEQKWGGVYLRGDCKSDIQIFHISAEAILDAHTFDVRCVPEDSHVLINVSGDIGGFDNLSLDALDDQEEKVLFNFYQATSLVLRGVEVEGSILAPFADIGVPEPTGHIDGTLIANSWYGRMSFEWEPYEPYNEHYVRCEGIVLAHAD
jgi:choice-of-anchor A domain-containing protein